MWVLLIAALLIVAVAAVVVVLRRPKGSDLSSVRKYHSALGTIEHLADRSAQTTGRVATPPAGSGSDRGGAGRSVPPVPVRGNGEFPDPEGPIVFDDARPRDHAAGHPSSGVAMHRIDRAQRQALESMNHRPRRATSVMVVVIVVALVGVLALLGSRHPKSTDRGHGSATTSVSATSSTGSAGHGNKHGHKHKSTTATVPPTQIVSLSSTPTSATYPVGSDTYRVTVTASGPCWVLATSTSTGSTLWTGTMQAGASQVIPATGTITVELGSATGTLAVDNVPVVFPTPANTPFVATFQPSGPSTSSTSTTAATVTTSTVG